MRVGRQPSRQAPNVKEAERLKVVAHETLVHHVIERHRMVVAHAGGDAVLQLFEHDSR